LIPSRSPPLHAALLLPASPWWLPAEGSEVTQKNWYADIPN
jgi:hypothetical protein